MKKQILSAAVLMMILSFDTNAITPVHLGRVSIDSLYGHVPCDFVPGPFIGSSGVGNPGQAFPNNGEMFLQAFNKKNSNQFDLYSFSGKIGTSIIPIINDSDTYVNHISFSRNMIDEDNGWESIVQYQHFIRNYGTFIDSFKVFDDDGTELLADSGKAYYGFDGNSTYVITWGSNYGTSNYDSWRFRTNISSSAPSLSKTQVSSQGLMRIFGQDNGNYRVTLSPSSGNQVKFQMFDLLGRCIFSKQINNITSSQTFTIPESDVPKSPFIAKFSDKNGSYFKKEIPVK